MTTITVSRFSRYKDTPVFDDQDGKGPKFGIFVPPAEFITISPGWEMVTVRQHEVGMLDILAVRLFGPGFEPLWWAIALANGIGDADADMYPGQRVWVPPSTVADQYVARFGT